MPSAQVLEQKKVIVSALADRLNASVAGVIVDYSGTNVTDDTALRKELREAGVEYTVVKNRLLKLAIQQTELNGLDAVLDGTTAIATSKEDYVAAARILSKFASTHKNFTIKNGFLDKEVIDLAKIDSLAKLPSRDVLLAQVLGAFQAPISAFARAIQAIVDKGGADVAEAAEAEAPAEEPAEAPVEAAPEAETAEPAEAPVEAPAAEEVPAAEKAPTAEEAPDAE